MGTGQRLLQKGNELLPRLEGYKSHSRFLHCLGDRLCLVIVIFLRIHIEFHGFTNWGRDEAHIVIEAHQCASNRFQNQLTFTHSA